MRLLVIMNFAGAFVVLSSLQLISAHVAIGAVVVGVTLDPDVGRSTCIHVLLV